MTEHAFDTESYKEHAKTIAKRFEERRGVFLKAFKKRLLIAVVLLLSMPFWFTYLSEWNSTQANVISGIYATLLNTLAVLLIVLFIISFAVLPLFRYRSYKVQYGARIPGMDGFASQTVSLKSEIFNALLSYFGTFELHNDRKLSLKKFHAAPSMPDFDEFVSEDYIEGRMHNMHVEITEARLLTRSHSSYIETFAGLMVIIETDDVDALHGQFSGKTVVIVDRSTQMDYVASKYSDYKRVPIADSAYGQRFEAFTTQADEADKINSSEMLRAILKLSDAVKNVKRQELSLDDRVAYMLGRITHGLSDMLAFLGARLAVWLQTGSFRVVSTRHALALPDVIREDAKALNQCVHATFFDNKVLITIPYGHNLFEPDSLFRSPLIEQDIDMVYQLMTSIGGIIDATISLMKR